MGLLWQMAVVDFLTLLTAHHAITGLLSRRAQIAESPHAWAWQAVGENQSTM